MSSKLLCEFFGTKKKIIITQFVSVIMLLFCGIISGCGSIEYEHDETFYDVDYEKQWYLQKNAKNVTINVENTSQTDFVKQSIVFDSVIDIGVLEFWNQYSVSQRKELVIAVLDSCVDIHQEDLIEHIWVNQNEINNNGIDDDYNGYIDDYYGWDFNVQSPNVYSAKQEASHGTHCAGIIAASHNSIGVRGILGETNVKLMIIPICDGVTMESASLVSGIKYADVMGADICCISSVFVEGALEIEHAINDSDMIFVVAAGNFESQFVKGLDLGQYALFPACCNNSNVVTVGSINEQKMISVFSNYNSEYVDVVAPGEFIYSTLPGNNYGYESGTSVAVPIVASIIGAYYYSGADTVKDAVALMYDNCEINTELCDKVKNGRVVKYVLQ